MNRTAVLSISGNFMEVKRLEVKITGNPDSGGWKAGEIYIEE